MIKEILHKPIMHIVVITIICIIAYSNTFSSSFIYDDKFVIVGSGIVKDLNNFVELSDARIFDNNLFISFVICFNSPNLAVFIDR